MPVWLLVTTRLFKVMLPALLTLPLKVSRDPGVMGLVGQFCVIITSGVVIRMQLAEAVLLTVLPVFESLPVAVNVSLAEQASNGTR